MATPTSTAKGGRSMKDFILTCILFFLGVIPVALLVEFLNVFLCGLGFAPEALGRGLAGALFAHLIYNRTWLRFEQKEGK